MTTEEIISAAGDLMDGETIEQSLGILLANHIKDWVEARRNWRMLVKENSDNNFGPSDNYLTAKALPDDFSIDMEVWIDDIEYTGIPFERRRRYKDAGQKYAIDIASNNMYVHGSIATSKPIYLYYKYQTDELAIDTSPVWPERFHKLISFLMTEIYLVGVEALEGTVQSALEHSKQGQIILDAMENWDDDLRLKSLNGVAMIR